MSRPIRVLLLIETLATGGAERSITEMLPIFQASGIDASIACFFRCGSALEKMVDEAGSLQFVEARGRLRRIRAVRRLVAQARPNLVHTMLFEADVAGRLACVGLPTIVMSSFVNTPYVDSRRDDPHIRPYRLAMVQAADGWTARHLADHFHAVGHTVKAHAVEKLHIQEERITVVERGRDPARLGRPSRERRERARRSLGLTDDDEVVVTLGREEYQKGQRYLLEAVAAVAARRPQLVGLLAGKAGSESERLRAWHAGSGLGDRFRFLGHRDDAPELLAAADLFVLPSLFEGFSGVLIEAMALGLPIVASDIPAIREVVEPGRNAVLVDPASSEALVTGIESLLDSRVQRQAYGERGRSIFEERFTLERSTSRMVELYRRLAESASASSATAARAEVQ